MCNCAAHDEKPCHADAVGTQVHANSYTQGMLLHCDYLVSTSILHRYYFVVYGDLVELSIRAREGGVGGVKVPLPHARA